MMKELLFTAMVCLAANLNAQEIIFEEDFNDESTWPTWAVEDRDGDDQYWEFADAEFQEVASFQGGFVWSFSWYFEVFTPDNTLISPAITLPVDNGLELTFKVAAYEDEELFQEHYAVYVIPADSEFTGEETPVFEETLEADYYLDPKTVNVDISSFGGQDVKLVFRHYNCTDIFYLAMDDIKIETMPLSVQDSRNKKISIYPNPTTDLVHIEGVEKIDRIRIFNLNGQMIREINASEANLSDLPSGMYLVNFYSSSGVYSRKIQRN